MIEHDTSLPFGLQEAHREFNHATENGARLWPTQREAYCAGYWTMFEKKANSRPGEITLTREELRAAWMQMLRVTLGDNPGKTVFPNFEALAAELWPEGQKLE